MIGKILFERFGFFPITFESIDKNCGQSMMPGYQARYRWLPFYRIFKPV